MGAVLHDTEAGKGTCDRASGSRGVLPYVPQGHLPVKAVKVSCRDERVLGRHYSGLKWTLAPSLAGNLKIWADLSGGSVIPITTYRNRRKFSTWLREMADIIEKA